jgi:glycylpeptide N-tetradecanoyltransferase
MVRVALSNSPFTIYTTQLTNNVPHPRALMSPGWRKDWHVGIRSGKTLCAFISAIPVQVRVRDNLINASEVNFMCVHKKLRNKRLAPVLIKEITRRCNREGVFQAIYTGGIVLPRPVSTCRYFHRAINWQKLWEVGFSPLPANSKPERQVRKYALPDRTATPGLREMKAKDVDAVYDLLARYLKRFPLSQQFDKAEISHWLLHDESISSERVVWAYVVEVSPNMFPFSLGDKPVVPKLTYYHNSAGERQNYRLHFLLLSGVVHHQ